MAILKKDTYKKQVIDLTGPDGNAYFLIGTAMNLMKQLDFTLPCSTCTDLILIFLFLSKV